MTPYRVLQVGDEFLKKRVDEIYLVTPQLKEEIKPIIERMIHTCEVYNGKGLSANQVGEDIRLFVMRPKDSAHYVTYINPKIVESGGRSRDTEGCLSFAEPKVFYNVRRKYWVELEYLNLNGETVKERFEEFDARCIQHELDHLNGILMDEVGKKK